MRKKERHRTFTERSHVCRGGWEATSVQTRVHNSTSSWDHRCGTRGRGFDAEGGFFRTDGWRCNSCISNICAAEDAAEVRNKLQKDLAESRRIAEAHAQGKRQLEAEAASLYEQAGLRQQQVLEAQRKIDAALAVERA